MMILIVLEVIYFSVAVWNDSARSYKVKRVDGAAVTER